MKQELWFSFVLLAPFVVKALNKIIAKRIEDGGSLLYFAQIERCILKNIAQDGVRRAPT